MSPPDCCPHCGSLVRVHTDGEGTSCYVSVAEEAIRKVLALPMPTGITTYTLLERILRILRRGLGEP